MALSGRGRLRPQSPRDRDEAGAEMAWWVGYGCVAVSDVRRICPAVELAMGAAGRGGGREKRRELRRSLPVGELMAFDMVAAETITRQTIRPRRYTEIQPLSRSPQMPRFQVM
jgi:hypothetical protein